MINLVFDLSKDKEKTKLISLVENLGAKKYCIQIKQWRKDRSNSQNRYYWGVVIDIISKETGNDKDFLHDHFAKTFIPAEVKFKTSGVLEKVAGKTSELTTAEFEEYLEQIRIWALAQEDIYIPLPGEINY